MPIFCGFGIMMLKAVMPPLMAAAAMADADAVAAANTLHAGIDQVSSAT